MITDNDSANNAQQASLNNSAKDSPNKQENQIKLEGWFDRIIQTSIHLRGWVMLLILGLVAIGIMSYQKLPIDAVPDITNVQVQINSAAPGFTALEAEQRITYPIE
ncbi:MAG: hypothetical protein EOO68_04025, partial [Moraxellaceae bacterium]